MGNLMHDIVDEISHPARFDEAPNHRPAAVRARFAPFFVGGVLALGLITVVVLLTTGV